MVSGNDAAVALSEFISGNVESFAELMNLKANELGLKFSHFVSPHGLDSDEHYTTAYDLAILTDYALKNPVFAKIVNTSNYSITINNYSKSLHNSNELLGYLDGVYGVKTGFTNGANRCLVTSCKRDNLDIICVVLGCDTKKDRTLDSTNLINYIFNNFSVVNLKNLIEKNFEDWKKNSSTKFKIDKGTSSSLNLKLNFEEIPYENIAINNSNINNISTPIYTDFEFIAPLNENAVIGKMDIYIDNTLFFSVNILNENKVERKDISYYLNNFTKNYFLYLQNTVNHF